MMGLGIFDLRECFCTSMGWGGEDHGRVVWCGEGHGRVVSGWEGRSMVGWCGVGRRGP